MVQTFWPVTTHSSPSSSARVASEARSEPAPGSLNSWHQHLLVAHDRRQEAQPLLLGAVGEQGRRGQVETERVQPPEVVRAQLGLDDPGRQRAEVEAAVLRGPGRGHQAGASEHRVPGLVVRPRTHRADRGRAAAAAASRHAPGTCSATQARTASAASSALVSGPIARRPASSLRVPVIAHRPSNRGSRRSPEGGQALAEVLAARRQLHGERLVAQGAPPAAICRGSCMSHLVSPRATVGPAASRATSASASASSSSAGTARWIRPHSCGLGAVEHPTRAAASPGPAPRRSGGAAATWPRCRG